jgi:hypothetical protein
LYSEKEGGGEEQIPSLQGQELPEFKEIKKEGTRIIPQSHKSLENGQFAKYAQLLEIVGPQL